MQSHRYELRRLRLISEQVVGTRVLDLGHAQFPNPYVHGPHVTGVDLAVPAQPSGYAHDLVGSVMDLGHVLDGQVFDTVIAAELIEHLERPYDFLRECRNSIAPGGRLVLSTPNPIGFPTLMLEAMRNRRYFYTSDHLYYFLPRWIGRMFEATGFELVETIGVGLWLPKGYVPWCPLWLSYQVIYVGKRA